METLYCKCGQVLSHPMETSGWFRDMYSEASVYFLAKHGYKLVPDEKIIEIEPSSILTKPTDFDSASGLGCCDYDNWEFNCPACGERIGIGHFDCWQNKRVDVDMTMVTLKEVDVHPVEGLFKLYQANGESIELSRRYIADLKEESDELDSKIRALGFLVYRGFIAEVFDPEAIDGPAHGRLIGIPDLVTFEAPFEFEELPNYFEEAVNDHIDMLTELGRPLLGSYGIPLTEFDV